MKSKSAPLFRIAAVALILAIVFGGLGLYKKNSYRNSEYITSRNVNAYDGGDAYNFIINGTYFSGYFALCGGLLASSAVTYSAGSVVLAIEEAQKNSNKSDMATSREDDLPSL